MNDLVLSPGMERWATLSPDGTYRYELGRRWNDGGRRLLWVMLNPSTAGADHDDATTRRCVGFSRAWGYDELVLVNVYAYRCTDPAELTLAVRAGVDLVGADNIVTIDRHVALAERVVAAWGAHYSASELADTVLNHHRPLWCLGTTKAGHPRHPLYVRSDQPLLLWRSDAEG